VTTVCPLCRCQSRAQDVSAFRALPRLSDAPAPDHDDTFQFSSYGYPLMTCHGRRGDDAIRVCALCADRSAAGSRRFDADVLDPIAAGEPAVVDYDQWLPRYAALLAWQGLVRELAGSPVFRVPDLQHDVFAAAEQWRACAAAEADDPGRFELHMLPIPRLAEDDVNRAYAFDVAHQRAVVTRTGEAWMWTKRPGVLLLGRLAPHAAGPLTDSRLETQGMGTWSQPATHVPNIVRFLMFEEWQRTMHASRYAAVETPCRA
jgi:hypothetical protein